MAATVLLWKASRKLPVLWPRFRLRNGVPLAEAPASKLSPHTRLSKGSGSRLPYRWMEMEIHLLWSTGSDERECTQFALYHVAQKGWLATAHFSTTVKIAQDILSYQGCKTDHQNETPHAIEVFP